VGLSSNDKKLLQELESLYGTPRTELDFEGPFQLLISVMLSAQSTDKKVNEVTKILFKKYPSPLSLSRAKLIDVENIIREVNYYKTKAKHLIETAKLLVEKWNSDIPETHEDLISLPGVGNKTANVVLSELGLAYALPVDTHVFRVSKRLGLANANTRDKVESELCSRFPKENWQKLHHWLIFHGRRVCMARSPKCVECTLLKKCPSGLSA
jgi:endonuclease-3